MMTDVKDTDPGTVVSSGAGTEPEMLANKGATIISRFVAFSC